MTSALGGEASGTFNAPARVRVSGGGWRPRARRLIDSLDAISVFEVAAVDGGAYAGLERRIGGLDPRTGNLVMRIAEGTPY